MTTFPELKEWLIKTFDPDELVELLDISSEQLIDRFEDKVEERFERLSKDLEGEQKEFE